MTYLPTSTLGPLALPAGQIPRGVADYFWQEAARRRRLEQALLAVFRSWGYGDVIPPSFEYADTFGRRGSTELLASIQPHLDEGHRMAPVIIDTLTAAFTDPTGYKANLSAILRAGQVEPRHLGLAVSAVSAYLRITEQQAAREARTERNTVLGYAGEVGEKVTLTGTIRQLFHVDGFTWHSPSRRMLIVDCGTSVAKMITGASWAYDVERGHHITLTGTVRKHEEWHGTPQTLIVRPKLITNHTTPPEPDPPDPTTPQVRTPEPAAPRSMAADQPAGLDTVSEVGPHRRFPDPPRPHTPSLAHRLTP